VLSSACEYTLPAPKPLSIRQKQPGTNVMVTTFGELLLNANSFVIFSKLCFSTEKQAPIYEK
jgi:hypothetical protein